MSTIDISNLSLTSLTGLPVPNDLTLLFARTNSLTDVTAISTLPTTLSILHLNNNPTLGSAALSNELAAATSHAWTELNFTDCGLTDASWNSGAFTSSLNTLTFLDLSNNSFSNISTLATALSGCTVLIELILSGNAGLTSLAGLPSSIIVLTANNCSINTLVGMPQNVVSLHLNGNASLSDLTGCSAALIDIQLTGTAVTVYTTLRSSAPLSRQITQIGAPLTVLTSDPGSITGYSEQTIALG